MYCKTMLGDEIVLQYIILTPNIVLQYMTHHINNIVLYYTT